VTLAGHPKGAGTLQGRHQQTACGHQADKADSMDSLSVQRIKWGGREGAPAVTVKREGEVGNGRPGGCLLVPVC